MHPHFQKKSCRNQDSQDLAIGCWLQSQELEYLRALSYNLWKQETRTCSWYQTPSLPYVLAIYAPEANSQNLQGELVGQSGSIWFVNSNSPIPALPFCIFVLSFLFCFQLFFLKKCCFSFSAFERIGVLEIIKCLNQHFKFYLLVYALVNAWILANHLGFRVKLVTLQILSGLLETTETLQQLQQWSAARGWRGMKTRETPHYFFLPPPLLPLYSAYLLPDSFGAYTQFFFFLIFSHSSLIIL